MALWDVGLDFLHGTGHGIGSFLNVHEGEHRPCVLLRTRTFVLLRYYFRKSLDLNVK